MVGIESNSQTLSRDVGEPARAERGTSQKCLQLVLLWTRHAPERVGETCAVTRTALLGRSGGESPGDPPKLEFMRQRPGENQHSGELAMPTLSRRQLRLEPKGTTLRVENLGKGPLLHNGMPRQTCEAGVGDTLGIDGVALFLVAWRPRILPEVAYASFPFGAADASGLVGETPELWATRNEVALLGRGKSHVIIFGASGTGKELCARALHAASERAAADLVSRNAATIPTGLVEAELFGNAPNYPHASLQARTGLVGLAHRATLFLDEVGELPEHQQANLLRVLDSGEYQRLGEDRVRHSDVRVLAATNRSPEVLKSDFLARFGERLEISGLDERRADIPLLARHVLRRLAEETGDAEPQTLGFELTDALVRHQYRLHHRELERLIRLARRHSTSNELELTEEVVDELDLPANQTEPSANAVREALAESKNASEAAKRLGLPSRFALYRVMKKLGIEQDTPRKRGS